MGKALVIVESPGKKAKTINKYLGNDTWLSQRRSSAICRPSGSASKKAQTLHSTKRAKKPKKDERSALVNRMGVNRQHNWDAHYEVLPGKEKVVNELSLLKKQTTFISQPTLTAKGEAITGTCRSDRG